MNTRIDVSELLTDPDFVGPIQQITRRPTVNGRGENILTECVINTVGSVQPISGKEVFKIPELMRVASMMTFFIKGTIVAVAPGKYSDILVDQGIRYQVLTVNDWSNWGEGWTEGACVAEVPAP